MNARLFRPMFTLALALVIASCGDDGPTGPGTLSVTVTGEPPIGAVIFDLNGTGLQSVRSVGSEWVTSTPTPTGIRVLVVSSDGAAINLEVDVAEISDPLPTSLVTQVSTTDDRRLPTTNGVTVTVAR